MRVAALLALVILGGAVQAATPEKPAGTFRAVTYNIRQGRGQTQMHAGGVSLFGRTLPRIEIPIARPRQLGRIAGHLSRLAPDLLMLQEVDDRSLATGGVDQAQALGRQLQMRVAFGVAHRQGFGLIKTQGNAVLSKHPIADMRVVELPHGGHGEERRSAVLVQVAHPALPGGLWAASCHLAAGNAPLRVRQGRALADVLAGLAGAVVVGGDFNAGPAAEELAGFLDSMSRSGKPLADTFATVGAGPGGTSSAPAGRKRIDYVMSSAELVPVRSWVARDINESDHFAVVTDFQLEDATLALPEPEAQSGGPAFAAP